ncbi:proline and serine-rich protein 3 isoform X2 [Channa argus]|uniref:proline and serine-rich protein 3 isoform X2 n=1 Tax=Channa argus TaxID=215402 RepID=UPI00352247B9
MKSSGPVFTRQNPFQSAPRVGKTHYNPSQKQAVTKKKKKTALSPVRLNQRPTRDVHTPSPESQHTFEKRDHRFAARGGQPVYAESWPSTDCESTPTILRTTSDMGTLKQSAKTRKTTVTPKPGVQEDSVLAKYIERFRHGQPQSREERRQIASAIGEEQLPFWWLSPSSLSPSSSPAEAMDKDVMEPLKDDHGPAIFSTPGPHQHDRTLSPCKTSLTVCSDTTQGEFDDTEILHLQERASRLLLRGNCTLSDGSVPVSSEGLGCSDFSSPVSVDEPVRKPVIPSLTKFASVKHSPDSAVSYQKCAIPSSATPNCPEEDILYQWRLRRKMEQAREWPQSVQHSNPYGSKFIWQAPNLNYPSANRKAYKHRNHSPKYSQMATPLHMTAPQQEPTEAHESYLPAAGPFPNFVVSGSSVSQPQTIAHVPAHMHLLCDVLPCPIQLSNASVQQNILQTSVDSKDRVVQKQKKVPRTSYVGPTVEHQSSSQPASSEAIEEELHSHQNRSERNRKENTQTNMLDKDGKKTVTSIKTQKKSTGNSEYSDKHNTTKKNFSHQRRPKKLIPWAEQRRHQGNQEYHSERCTGDHIPSSLIHSALGQVVSEVLFPEDSSPAQKTPVSLVSPPSDASAQSPAAVNSVEVILQLMQEAEDSDEKEFEDDPLLQVLRKQRKWVNEQISEVDSMLNGFLNKNK